MPRLFFASLLLLFTTCLSAQDMTKFKLYHPEEDAKEALENAVERAEDENKHVFVQIGGNWCVWCARFDDFVKSDASIDSLIKKEFVVYHLNHSKENRNEDLLEKYRFPQRFGFPVFLVLDGKGKLLHTQNSWYLESGKSYDREKVMAFLNDWKPSALDPRNYKEQ